MGKANKKYLTWIVWDSSYKGIASQLEEAGDKEGIKDLTLVQIIFTQCKQ
jgi:hypothetical protein